MALKNCRECGCSVSTQAYACPACGAPRPTVIKWMGTGLDWRSDRDVFGIPLIHVAFGRNENGKLRVAKGVIAIGQFGIGLITIAQFGIGFIFGFGQFIFGMIAVAQFALGVFLGVGQFATGMIVAGQFVFGVYGLGKCGWAKYIWTSRQADPEAVELFGQISRMVTSFFK